MKILNLYAGIGGNRKLWGNEHTITAIENEVDVAQVYKTLFPQDDVVVCDAHAYLLDHFQEYDFIWASPPCQTHSVCNNFLKGQGIFRYPDMRLWQEIIFLKHFFKGRWLVENVKSYYKPVIEPTKKLGRHYFWANFEIADKNIDYVQIGTMNRRASKDAQRRAIIREAQIPELINLQGLNNLKIKLKNKKQVLRNCVLPELGKHVLDCSLI
jgi:DNA (cytosine-5)-methyltransferase 1